MLRISRTYQSNVRRLTSTVSRAMDVTPQVKTGNQNQRDNSVSVNPALTPISRYIPSSGISFLVEEYRLTESEKTTQRVSAILPWLLFCAFAVTPFFVMKYNLQKLYAGTSVSTELSKNVGMKSVRYKFGLFSNKDIPELLSRRSPTLVCLVSENYHSQIMSRLFEEIDGLFEAFGIKINVALVELGDDADINLRKLAPHCQFFTSKQGDANIYSYEGPWSVSNIIRFVIPEKEITQPMRHSIIDCEDRIASINRDLFRRQFIDTK